jgi:hypothetical protein
MFVIKDQTNAGSIVINNFSHCVYQSLRLQVATLTKSLRLQSRYAYKSLRLP